MTIDNVLNDGEAQPGAATFAAPPHIDPVEALGQPGDRFAGYSLAFILHGNENLARAFASGGRGAAAEVHPNFAPFTPASHSPECLTTLPFLYSSTSSPK